MTTPPPTLEFRRVCAKDRPAILAIAERTWDGHDYLPAIFDTWVADSRAYFGALVRDGRLIGCCRVHPFDDTHGWLEALRVHPDHQHRGLGRELARHVMSQAVAMGLRQLHFSTYFKNVSSIRISEQIGFQRRATFTNLELHDLQAAEPDARFAETLSAPEIEVRNEVPAADAPMANDWFFVPPEVSNRARYFPDPVTLRGYGGQLLLADNSKFADHLEVAWVAAPEGRVPVPLIRRAIAEAHRRRRASIHLMLPEGYALDPFQELGFRYYERALDVPLYVGRVADLRL
jgi:RimJ/RimL family protein N-acetyltransferase